MSHTHTAEAGIGNPAASGSVALDIGGGLGALVITPSERFRSREIEISRRRSRHTAGPHGRP